MKYLSLKNLITEKLIIELIFKFAVRIGAISKLKVNSILENDYIIFNEKNNVVLRRKLNKDTSNKIKVYIEKSIK